MKSQLGKIAPSRVGETPATDLAADQLKAVMKANFKSRALLNKREAEVFKALYRIVIARNPQWQVMAQVQPSRNASDRSWRISPSANIPASGSCTHAP